MDIDRNLSLVVYVPGVRMASWCVNKEKSHWEPAQPVLWLGVAKVERLRQLLHDRTPCSSIITRRPAKIAGTIMSMSLALGSVTRLRTRALYSLIESRVRWYADVRLTEAAVTELRFWNSCVEEYNGQPVRYIHGAVRVVYSDASDTGYGGFTVKYGPQVAHGQ